MYLENRNNINYLIKKSWSKKIYINLWNKERINIQDIKNLSEKEFTYLSQEQKYLEFKREIYNGELLDNVISETIFLSNQINNELLEEKSIFLENKYRDFAIKFIYESNKTEWSKIPFESVFDIIKQKKSKYKIKNEIIEVENSIRVWDFINNKFIFNIANIKKLYHILTKWLLQENWNKYPRWFKKIEIVVNNNMTSNPENVEFEMKNLLLNLKQNSNLIHPLKLAFDFHLKYEQIHPFENWNWRTWRFLLNKILISKGLLPMIVFEENRQAYFNAINSVNNKNKKKYYKFMLEQYYKTIKSYWN